ncbi:MAG: hypothetical protein AAB692_04060 [Patescibacteria group bacterium]
MGKKISLFKILAVGAVLAGVAKVAMSIKNDDKKSKEMIKLAKRIKESVSDHAAKVGKMSKTTYDNLVDTAMNQLENIKDLSGSEVKTLKRELKRGWSSIKSLLEK